MKILIVNDFHVCGGAGIAAARLAGALEAAGHDVHWAVAKATAYADNVHQYTDQTLSRGVIGRIGNRLAPDLTAKRAIEHQSRRIENIARRINADVINVHNLHGANLPATLPAQLSAQFPVVWTLHDMWAFTGTCAYSFECDAFAGICTSRCPHHAASPAADPADVPVLFTQRKEALKQSGRLSFVSPSQWLAQQAARGLLRDHDIDVIPNSVDLDTFKPIDRPSARRALDIAEKRPAVLSFGDATESARKGAHLLPEALRTARCTTLTWITIASNVVADLPRSIKQINFDNVSDPRLLNLLYNAADVFVLPTLADNLPNVLLEAAACGTPSVAFDVGGVRETMPANRGDHLVPPGDTVELGRTIKRILGKSMVQKHTARKSLRAFAAKRFNWKQQAERYCETFTKRSRHIRKGGQQHERTAHHHYHAEFQPG